MIVDYVQRNIYLVHSFTSAAQNVLHGDVELFNILLSCSKQLKAELLLDQIGPARLIQV